MRVLVAYNWRIPKLLVALMVIELPLTVINLILAGIADPNTYRTKLWQNGADQGFNSSPNIILYSYANHRPLSIPMIWSTQLTTFNVVISVLSMFLLLTKSAMFTMHCWIPLISVLVHAALIALYSVSLSNQLSGDYLDPEHPAAKAWYLTKSCSIYASPGNTGFCLQARAQTYVVGVMLLLFIVYFVYGLWSCIPTEKEKEEREAERQLDLEIKKLSTFDVDGYEMDTKNIFLNLPKTPATSGFGLANPMTPRTTAFARLNGGAAPETRAAAAANGGNGNRALPFREQYDTNNSTA